MGWPAGPRGSGSRNLGSTRRSHARPGSQVGAWRRDPGRCARCAWPQLEADSPATAASTGERRARKLAYGVGRRAGGKGLLIQYLACGLSDFVCFCETREDAEQVQRILAEWLKERGLTLSAEKTRIVHLTEGFNFLGYVRHGSCTRGCCDRAIGTQPGILLPVLYQDMQRK